MAHLCGYWNKRSCQGSFLRPCESVGMTGFCLLWRDVAVFCFFVFVCFLRIMDFFYFFIYFFSYAFFRFIVRWFLFSVFLFCFSACCSFVWPCDGLFSFFNSCFAEWCILYAFVCPQWCIPASSCFSGWRNIFCCLRFFVSAKAARWRSEERRP